MNAAATMPTGNAICCREPASVVVTGWGIHIPNVDISDMVPEQGYGPACPADCASELLGRKGLLYKEPATRLALCAVHRALGRSPGAPRPDGPPDPRTAVVVSSNLGNIATVHKLAAALQHSTVRYISSLDAPNASSNVIASTIAIWFRCGGPNLMVCSGSTSGLDAVVLGRMLLYTRRADRVLVIGTEPEDKVAAGLTRKNSARLGNSQQLRAGAACVILERPTQTAAGLTVLEQSRYLVAIDSVHEISHSTVLLGPAELAPEGTQTIDLEHRIGNLSGALGVVQLAVSAALMQSPPAPISECLLISGNRVEGWRSLTLSRRGPTAAQFTDQ